MQTSYRTLARLKVPEYETPKFYSVVSLPGLLNEGSFTLFIAKLKDSHGTEFIFTEIAFEELANGQQQCEEIEHAEMDEESFEEAKKIEELRNLWLNATNF
ncbi:hypothetical protein P0Y67_14730 [Photobacterium sp. SP02]|uniref:hypothetical protein n=1 Tax=Photobacterium sp. SP02 TaxID=3032280 RepID=UPI003144D7A5